MPSDATYHFTRRTRAKVKAIILAARLKVIARQLPLQLSSLLMLRTEIWISRWCENHLDSSVETSIWSPDHIIQIIITIILKNIIMIMMSDRSQDRWRSLRGFARPASGSLPPGWSRSPGTSRWRWGKARMAITSMSMTSPQRYDHWCGCVRQSQRRSLRQLAKFILLFYLYHYYYYLYHYYLYFIIFYVFYFISHNIFINLFLSIIFYLI